MFSAWRGGLVRPLPVLPVTAASRVRARVLWLAVRRPVQRADGSRGTVRGAARVLRVELGPGLAAVLYRLG